MSEYQWIEFRAIDGPVSSKNLEYMQKQSSRAEITPWSFTVEYHYSDFHGNAAEMLRRGYDFHLNYANYGIRKLMIRLPQGLPDPKGAAPYFEKESLEFIKDPHGHGGIISVQPYLESEDGLFDLDELFEELIPLRAEILDGDLRPLYLLHLAVACDGEHDPDQTTEGPVPAGLGKLSKAQIALAEFFDISDSLISAAARQSAPLPSRSESKAPFIEWIERQSLKNKDAWLVELLVNPEPTVRREIISAFQKDCPPVPWPTASFGRTTAELMTAAEEIEKNAAQKAAAKAVQQHKKHLALLAADPNRVLKEADQFVTLRGSDSYQQAAKLLADLREALAGSDQAELPAQHAKKLRADNPTLRTLISALKKEGFLAK